MKLFSYLRHNLKTLRNDTRVIKHLTQAQRPDCPRNILNIPVGWLPV